MIVNKFSIIYLLVAVFCVSCSGTGKSPVANDTNKSDWNIPSELATGTANRNVLAIYDASINPIARTFTVTPSQRTADYHYPLTQLYPNVLQITAYGWTPNFWADIKITHPLPYSGIDGFDPRVIAILPANPGVRMNYPVMNVVANNSVVLNPDGYTRLHDWIAPSIPGNANPFLAYFKHVEYRRWFSSGTGFMSNTRRWEMDINGFGGPMLFKLVVDVSLNYPAPPQQVIDNAPEPVQIETFIDQGMTSSGGSARIEVTLTDWQGPDEIQCKVECPELFSNTIQLLYESPGVNPNEYVFVGSILNEMPAPEGDYNILIAALDVPSDPDIHVFKEVIAVVENDINFNPVDVTPPWLYFEPEDIFVDGDYLFVACGERGLHIYDISNPRNPVWVNIVDTPDWAYDVCATGGYAYIADRESGLQIIDVDPPQSAFIVKSVSMPGAASDLDVSNGYAYVGSGYRLQIIDIDPPESASIIKEVVTQANASHVYASNGYAYVCGGSMMNIIDIDPPETANIVKLLDFSMPYGYLVGCSFYVSGDYAYYTCSYFDEDTGDFHCYYGIVDIRNPPNASIICRSGTGDDSLGDIYTKDNYAYLGAWNPQDGLRLLILNIESPNSPYVVEEFDMRPGIGNMLISGIYMYYLTGMGGNLGIIEMDSPINLRIIKSIYSLTFATTIGVSEGVGCVADYHSFDILDTDPPESTFVTGSIDTWSIQPDLYACDVAITNGYAFVANYKNDIVKGLYIIDIEPPDEASVIKIVDTPGDSIGIFLSGEYAYLADGESGLQIIDIEPIDAAHIIKSVDTPGFANRVFIAGEYAYVADRESGLQIIDINPIDSAFILNTVDTPGKASDIAIFGNYAYVADDTYGLQIIDIKIPQSAQIIKNVHTPGYAYNICVSGGYAYLTDFYDVRVIDCEPPDAAHIELTIDTPGTTADISLVDNYLFVADGWKSGLRIIKLW